MNIDDLTVGQAKELAALFGSKAAPKQDSPWVIDRNYLIRTVTMTLTGRLVFVGEHELALEDAAWIADTGRFFDALRDGTLSEVEPFPEGRVIVGRGAIVDAAEWSHPLPRDQK